MIKSKEVLNQIENKIKEIDILENKIDALTIHFSNFSELKEYKLNHKEEAAENNKKIVEFSEVLHIKKIELELLKNNERAAIIEEVKPVVIEVLKKYNGKKYGPKTADLIREELKNKLNTYIFINKDYFTINTCNSTNIVVGTEYDNENSRHYRLIDNDNKITLEAIEHFRCWYEKIEYIENVNERATAIIASYNKYKKAVEEANQEIEKYNNLLVGNLESENKIFIHHDVKINK